MATRNDLIYFSQFGEDRILDRIFGGRSTGYCVEVGANDGLTGSTTLYFESKGWQCLLIEPNPDLCQRLRHERSSMVVECAASDTSAEVSLYVAEGAPGAHAVSTIEGSVDDALRQIGSHGFTGREVRVKTQTLDDILGAADVPAAIDFVTIDVEGHELAVLKGLSLARWHPSVLIVEDNTWGADLRVRHYLLEHGYVPIRRTGVNDWYSPQSSSAFHSATTSFFYGLSIPIQRLKFTYLPRGKAFVRKLPGVLWLWTAWKAMRVRSNAARKLLS
jgi:FkbM family methyltransferase